MSEWQPIETAPKDGTPILLLSAGDEFTYDYGSGTEHVVRPPRCFLGVWNAEGDAWTDEDGGFDGPICQLTVTGNWTVGSGWLQPDEVTHWMPLPDPPVHPQGETGE